MRGDADMDDRADRLGRGTRLAAVAERYEIAFLYLFGSRAAEGADFLAGEEVRFEDPLADLDVGVVFRRGLPAEGRAALYARLYNDLEDVFAPLPLDLTFLEETHSVFAAQAVAGICVYEYDREARLSYEERVLARAADFKPFLRRYLREAMAEGASRQ